jgi:hypothetical protein
MAKLKDIERGHVPLWLVRRMQKSRWYKNLHINRAGFDWIDHSYSKLCENGERIWVCEPYGITTKSLEQICTFVTALDLKVSITTRATWNGECVKIKFSHTKEEWA